MSTEVTFYITIKDANIDTIAHTLRNLGLTVFPSSISDVGEEAFDPNHLTCSAVFVETDGLIGLVLARKESWKKIDGIENIEIIHDKRQKEKRPWYDHFMIPLLISTAVY
ncbi:MAG TPA: hypothetical protein VKA95_17695, partial [Nitrososphaeraceae archaeon]|nr:hypothetical protein [Nitrososphaeraceae archaeon]